LKSHKETEKVDFSSFKDELRGTSLVTFLKALPETQVKTVIIAKQLAPQEQQLKISLEKSLANRGLSIIVKAT
jgi:hypothetical protein